MHALTYLVAAGDSNKANYFVDLFHRLTAEPVRLAICLIIAGIAIATAVTVKSAQAKVISWLAVLGGFFWGWWIYNFANHIPGDQSLFGPYSAYNSLSDLIHGWNFVWTAVGVVLWMIVAKATHGFMGWFAGFLAFTGVLMLVNIITNLQAY